VIFFHCCDLNLERGISDMNDTTKNLELSDEDILPLEVSDETLEAIAGTTRAAAMSTLLSPTVSIFVACC
jgi:hypothetical protein